MACTGNQYGGFSQTLFLGCSVVSFSANAGWGEQSTEVTIELVEDDCPAANGSSKVYWDLQLNQQTWTAADPGFAGEVFDIVGIPAYFRLADYEFTGLIQSWEKVNNTSGRRYIVKLVSPVSILQNTKLLIGGYSGPIADDPFSFKTHNLINVYGYAEKQGVTATQYYQSSPGVYSAGDAGDDGAVFGTAAGGFGGSLINPNGMPWYMIRNVFNVLVNSSPLLTSEIVSFSPNGRVTGKSYNVAGAGSPWSNGFGLLSYDSTINASNIAYYFIDLSELPNVPDYFRFNQTEISILEAITRVCQEGGYDFYIELLPIKEGAGVNKFIKIRTVSRLSAPSFVADAFANNAQSSGTLRGSSIGREFRNEVNSRFIIGGLKQTLYQAYQNYDPWGDGQPANPEADDMILPYFGSHDNGDMIVPTINSSGDWQFDVSSSGIEASLDFITFSGLPVTITESEIRGALSSFELWVDVLDLSGFQSDTKNAIDNIQNLTAVPNYAGFITDICKRNYEKFGPNSFYTQPENSGFFQAAVRDLKILNLEFGDPANEIQQFIESDIVKIHKWIASFGENYGTTFAVRVPRSYVTGDNESNQLLNSELPTQDGGWTEQTGGVLGLGLNSDELTFFRNSSNKIETMVAFTGYDTLDVSTFNPDDYVLHNNNIYLRGTVSSDYIYHDASTYNVPRALVTIPQPMTSGTDGAAIVHGIVKLGAEHPGHVVENYVREAFSRVGGQSEDEIYMSRAFLPDAVAFGVASTVNTYGPWVSIGKVGGIEVDKDDGLVPWEYGGYTNLNLAGNALAQAGTTQMQVGEMGNVSIVGYPEIPLGTELNALTALGGQQLVENRTGVLETYNGNHFSGPFSQTYFSYSYPFNQSGVYGPTVTNINVNVGTEVTTQYQFRTYTPRVGRFARMNAERLKEINQNRMKYVRDLRNYIRNSASTNAAFSIAQKTNTNKNLQSKSNFMLQRFNDTVLPRHMKPGTPHELFVGQMVDWGHEGQKRTIISTSSFNDAVGEINKEYQYKSITSFDSIIRPISLRGAGGLPRLIQPTVAETGNISSAGGAGAISQADLNPYINPLAIDDSGVIARRYQHDEFGSGLGHDFDCVSRGNFINGNFQSGIDPHISSTGLLMHGLSGDYDYTDDYKTMALRGPLLLHSWGYDTSGYPIPNYVDTPSGILDNNSIGQYEKENLTGTFMSGWATRPDTWPVAPVDLRMDRERGVWVAGGIPEQSSQEGVTIVAIATGTIDAMSVNTGTLAVTPGDGSGTLMDTSSVPFTPSGVVGLYNLSMTPIRASVESPVVLTCSLLNTSTGVGSGVEVDRYIVSSIMDFRAIPGFATGSTGGAEVDPDMQIPYHPGGVDSFTMDSVECSGTGMDSSG